MRRFVPRVFTGLRARLVLGFLVVTLISLGLVFATLPRLLDGYFLDQAQQDLNRRTQQVGFFIALDIIRASSASDAPRPILDGDPLAATQAVQDALGTPDKGNVLDLAQLFAQANIHVQIATDVDDPSQLAFQLDVPVGAEVAQAGQQRESLSSTQLYQVTLPDTFWSQEEATAPKRQLIVSLSDPYTYRAQTINQIISVMAVAGVIALIVAVIASVLIADRLSNPIRRLTGAARELSEGHLETRVPPPSTSREMGELTVAFNSMAERVQASMEYISRDRDRSRDFLADVSHELKTPIAALRTFNELLRDGQVKDEATQTDSWNSLASRSSVSTGSPPTCSSCPSSSQASCCSTCAQTICALSWRTRCSSHTPPQIARASGSWPCCPTNQSVSRTIRSAWARCWATCWAMRSSSHHAAARFA
jgi:signal transduction histidine kinase